MRLIAFFWLLISSAKPTLQGLPNLPIQIVRAGSGDGFIKSFGKGQKWIFRIIAWLMYVRLGLSRDEEAAKSPANHFCRGHVARG